MPLYDFECPHCSVIVERAQSHKDPAPECDRCQLERKSHVTMKRVLSGRVGFDLRGSGWYAGGYQGYNVKK